jgi:hypothetical protein
MTTRCPSDLALEGFLLDPERSPIASHLDGCARCAERLERMRAEGADFARNVFPLTVDAVEKAAARRPWWRRVAFVLPVPALAAAAAVFLLVRPAGPPEGYLGLKGAGAAFGITLYTLGPAGVEAVADGEAVSPSARLRFRVRAGAPCHLWIASVDADGTFSRLYPLASGVSAPITAGEHDLPGGAVLDGVPGPERVFALCSPGPLAWSEAEASLRISTARPASVWRPAQPMGLPHGTAWVSVLLEKRP